MRNINGLGKGLCSAFISQHAPTLDGCFERPECEELIDNLPHGERGDA